jgi:hypothetical protein
VLGSDFMILLLALGSLVVLAGMPPGEGFGPNDPPQTGGSASAAPQGGTANLELLRVEASFLEHDLRLDYSYEDNIRSAKTQAATNLSARIAVPIDTSLMVAVAAHYEWLDERDGKNENGAAGSVLGRVPLVQEADSSYAFNLRLGTPNKGVGNDKTVVAAGISGFEDLDALLGLDRVGAYAHLEFQHTSGPGQIDGGNHLEYVLSLAKTWTDAGTPVLGRFSTFAEFGGSTAVDVGSGEPSTLFITPGIRMDLAPRHALVVGADFPLSQPHGFGQTIRFSYVLSF